MDEVRELYADPTASPFLRYGGGYAVFPPNEVRPGIAAVLEALDAGLPSEEAWRRLVRYAWVGGETVVHPESTWHVVGLEFVRYYEQHFRESPGVRETGLAAARLMLEGDVGPCWDRLLAFLIEQIDVASGWSASWLRADAEARGVVRHADGTYWFPDASGTLIQITGATTLPETRLDFLTDSVIRPWGAVRHVLELFAIVATGEDFKAHPEAYPTALRLAIYDGRASRWQRRNHYEARTVRWRPPSNLADAEWLAQTVAARIVDATTRDVWREHVDTYGSRPSRLEDRFTRQIDFVLDSSLLIGDDDEVYLTFEGRTFRWINGTPESRGILSVGCDGTDASIAEAERASDRLLSFLVWDQRSSIAKLGSAGGPRRSLPIVWEARMSGGTRVAAEYAVSAYRGPFSPKKWLALALHREGITSRSVFYRFLNFWKVVELAIADQAARETWIDQKAAVLSRAPTPSVPIYEWLQGSARDAIAHVSMSGVKRRGRKKRRAAAITSASVDPDDYAHRIRVSRDADLMRDLALLAIREGLAD